MTELVPGTIYTTPGGGKISVSKKGDLAIHTDSGFRSLPLNLWCKAHGLYISILKIQEEFKND